MTSTGPLSGRATLTVLIPAHQEAEAIRSGRLATVLGWGSAQDPPPEILVVDDGSEDGTGELAEACGASVLRIPHGGKAAAVEAGLLAAGGDLVLITDMDQATPIVEAAKLLDAVAGGADIAIGSRGFRRPGAPFARWAMSWSHWLLRRLLVGLPWSDTQCGFKVLRRSVALDLLGRLLRYGPGVGVRPSGPCVSSGFDVELLLVARRTGRTIAEVPVAWHYADTRRVAKFRDAWRGTADLLAIASALRRGAYGPARGPGGAR